MRRWVIAAATVLTVGFTTAPAPATPPPTAHAAIVDDGQALDLRNLVDRATRTARIDVQLVTALPVQHLSVVPRHEPDPPPAPAGNKTTVKAPAPIKPPTVAVAGRAGIVVAYARAQVGKRYVFATAGPNTFDCSGLVVAAYNRIGISLPHQTGGLIRRGRAVSRSQLIPGDLVFPSSGHVAIYIGNGLIVHASNPRTGVKISTIYSFWAARRIL